MTTGTPFQSFHFRGAKQQRLQNVPVVHPSIIWVQRGQKSMQWRNDLLQFDYDSWMILSSGQRLTFVNRPFDASFHSIQLAFFEAPDADILALGEKTSAPYSPAGRFSSSLAFAFRHLLDVESQGSSNAVMNRYLQAFYLQLAEEGFLQQLFPEATSGAQPMHERVSRYLANDPAMAHDLENVAGFFNMSKSTLARRLAEEGQGFRELLAEARMVLALGLMQTTDLRQLDLALACGYQSESRFASRFKQQFGITPRHYALTLEQKAPALVD